MNTDNGGENHGMPTDEEMELFRRDFVRLIEEMGAMANHRFLIGPSGESVKGLLRLVVNTMLILENGGGQPQMLAVVHNPAPAAGQGDQVSILVAGTSSNDLHAAMGLLKLANVFLLKTVEAIAAGGDMPAMQVH